MIYSTRPVVPLGALYSVGSDVSTVRRLSGLGVLCQKGELTASALPVADFLRTQVVEPLIRDLSFKIGMGEPLLSPDDLPGKLEGEADGACRWCPESCEGVDLGAVIAGLTAQYAQAYAAATAGKQISNVQVTQQAVWDGYGYRMVDNAQVAAVEQFVAQQEANYAAGGTAFSVPQVLMAPSSPTQTGGGNATAAPPAGGSGMGASAVLRNVSRSNMPLAVGDSFELTVSGPANTPVMITAEQTRLDGSKTAGTSQLGVTDSAGRLVVVGTMGTAEVGAWQERFTIGAASAVLSFSVSPAAVNTGGGPTPGTGASVTGGGSSTGTGLPVSTLPYPAPAPGLPSWVIPAAAAAALVFFLGGRR